MTELTENALATGEWTDSYRVDPTAVGPEYWPWLIEEGSLTQRLRERCHPHVRVRVLGEQDDHLQARLAAMLDSADGAGCLVREVLLTADGTPRIFARTLIPEHTLAANPWLGELGDNPLGDALFMAKDRERDSMDIAWLTEADPLHQRAAEAVGEALPELWCRRTIHRIKGYPLMVCECFLPTILDGKGA